MKIATDEIFGPVQSILKYKTIDEVSIYCVLSHLACQCRQWVTML